MAGHLYVGLMSGTSLDGVDAVLADFSGDTPRVLAAHHVAFSPPLRAQLLALAEPFAGELDAACEAGLALTAVYADAACAVIAEAGFDPRAITAIGCHGQTIRHRPERGYTLQIGAPAALAERTGIAVVADFRSADLAAGGQGAPLAPGFHASVFRAAETARVVLNLGGIANLTRLVPGLPVIGFDCGPANILLDAWIGRHRGDAFDLDGAWAASGQVIAPLLDQMLAEPFFALPAPKSTGRDLFNIGWVDRQVARAGMSGAPPQDVQATLLALSVESTARAIESTCTCVASVIACGGGARNAALVAALARRCAPSPVMTSAAHGIEPEAIEPLAFAWLARERIEGRPGNLPAVTGAAGPRVLGAVYPAP
jgi:anhydro-N-acetylmuramic acid kinase